MDDLAHDWSSHWTLDPSVRFLNHGSFGAVMAEVQEYQQDFRERLEREPVDFLLRQVPKAFEEARASLAEFLNADPAGLVFVRNATDGVNAVLRSLRFEPGDEFVCTNHGYNACNNVLEFVAERWGGKVIRAEIPFPIQGPEAMIDSILGALTPKTRLVLIDHVTSPTGLVFPVESLVPMLRERGILTLVDGAHSPGMLPLDLDALGADFYVGNGHKWLCAPKTVGFLHVAARFRDVIVPTTISHGANSPRPGFSRLQDQFDWPGTVDPSPILCLPHAMEQLERLLPGGWASIYRRNRALALQGRRLLCATLAIDEPSPESMIGFLAAVPLPPAPPEFQPGPFEPDPLHKALWERHRVEVPVFHYPGNPPRLLRISAHLHNGLADYEALAAALVAEGLGVGV